MASITLKMHRIVSQWLKIGAYTTKLLCARHLTVVGNYKLTPRNFTFLLKDHELKSSKSIRSCYTRVRPSNNSINNVNDLIKYLNEDKHIHLRFITNILDNVQDLSKLHESDIILLLQQCGKCIPNESNYSRNVVCQRIYENVNKFENVSLDVINAYIKVCTENRILLNYEKFVSNIKVKPDASTYKLLLKNVCEKGDIDQAFDILNDMKDAQFSVDEEVFNDLVLGHTIFGGLQDGRNVMQTMRAALVQETDNTKLALLKGVCMRNNFTEFCNALLYYSFECNKSQILELLETVAIAKNNDWIHKLVPLFNQENINREFIRKLEQLCIYLINMRNPEAAVIIYRSFITPSKEEKYALFLFREMLHCNASTKLIINFAKSIKDEGINEYILENVLEIALKHRYISSTWVLLKELPVLKTHYFWPLLVSGGVALGEDSVITTLQKMKEMNVPIDDETLELYCFPYCDTEQAELLVNKLKTLGVSVKESLSPMLSYLLYCEKTSKAAELCDLYGVQLKGERILKLLPTTWSKTKNCELLVKILKRICMSDIKDEDIVGEFLIKSLKLCKTAEELTAYSNLLEAIEKKRLKINSASADILLHLYSKRTKSKKLLDLFSAKLDSIMDYALKSEVQQFIHPRDMNLEQLECHLIELKSKKMETRGVLRKLIQKYASNGNIEKVSNLRDEFIAAGYEESAGIKSSILHTYTQNNCLKLALQLYRELKEKHTNFKLDEFKVIDLCSLMVKEGLEKEAIDLMKNESLNRKVTGGIAIERNCLQLLSNFDDKVLQMEMFDLLVYNGYCKASNIILGPLVRIHLKKKDTQTAVETFTNLSEKYKCTPLKLELLCEVLESGQQELFQKALEATAKIHGVTNANETLIVALSEKGLVKPLKSFLQEGKTVPNSRFSEICNRWAKENNLEALQTLLLAVGNSNVLLDVSILHLSILNVYCSIKDCEGAINFWESLKDSEVFISKDLEKQLESLLVKCNYRVPDSLRLTNR